MIEVIEVEGTPTMNNSFGNLSSLIDDDVTNEPNCYTSELASEHGAWIDFKIPKSFVFEVSFYPHQYTRTGKWKCLLIRFEL